jgi:hypothetical protein
MWNFTEFCASDVGDAMQNTRGCQVFLTKLASKFNFLLPA